MAISDTGICNMSLNAINARSTIQSVFPSDGSLEADTCAIHYETARNAALRSVHWNFARKQLPLAVLKTSATGALTPWQFEYAYPSDCVKAREIMPWVDSIPASSPLPASPLLKGNPIRFVESSDVDSGGRDIKVILTSQPQANLVYTKRITDPGMFDDMFIDAFSLLLAAKICVPLSGSAKLAKSIFDRAMGVLLAAAGVNGNEGIEIQDTMPDWLRVRGYLTDYGFPDQWIYDGPGQVVTLN